MGGRVPDLGLTILPTAAGIVELWRSKREGSHWWFRGPFTFFVLCVGLRCVVMVVLKAPPGVNPAGIVREIVDLHAQQTI